MFGLSSASKSPKVLAVSHPPVQMTKRITVSDAAAAEDEADSGDDDFSMAAKHDDNGHETVSPSFVATRTLKALDADGEDKYGRKRAATERLSTWFSLVVLAYLTLTFLAVHYMDVSVPAPLTLKEVSAPDRFVEERARAILRKLVSVGPRPAGSYENEVLAAEFIKRTLNDIKKSAKPHHRITVDVQKPRGSFNLKFLDGLTHHYKNIQNIAAKFESGHGAKDSLLVNCHFDSVPQSPAASDDGVSCAIMLEVLNNLAQSDEEFKHNVVFLFNGAEENLVPASHGFITQHVWAEDLRAFINLEACGAGGRELVFQSGPGNPWLIQAYAKAAPHPFASVVAQEIFQMGIVPGDTDFRIFRDFGKIPGLDIAYIKNGYVYHTKYDTEENIQPGSIQRAGENVLSVVKHLIQSEVLSHPPSGSGLTSSSSYVFFDFLGLFMICYPGWAGMLINLTVASASIFITVQKARNSTNYGLSPKVYLRQLGYSFLVQCAGCVASLISVTMVAIVLDAMAKSMSWYGKPYLILFLYMAPTVMSVVAVIYFAMLRQKKFFQFRDGVWVIESLYFEVSKLVWTAFTLVLTFTGFHSGYFCMVWVAFPMAGRFFLDSVYDRSAVKARRKDWKWICVHLISLTVPLILNMYLISLTFTMFVPVMGRSGSTFNPDLVIGFKASVMTLATMSYLCPLVIVMRKPTNVTTALYMTTIITGILVCTTRLGFPYSPGPKGSPHRSMILHSSREFYSKNGSLVAEDSGYTVINLDRNSPGVLRPHIPEFLHLKPVTEKQCRDHLYCGIPIYYPATSILRINNWIKASKPRIYSETSLKLLHTESPSPYTVRLLFETKGPDHMGITFSPVSDVTLQNWSFADGEILAGPKWKDDRPTYYIFHSDGLTPGSWQFWLEFKVRRGHEQGVHDLMDMVVIGHITHGSGMKSPAFKEFLEQFPPWSCPVGWTASYKAFKF